MVIEKIKSHYTEIKLYTEQVDVEKIQNGHLRPSVKLKQFESQIDKLLKSLVEAKTEITKFQYVIEQITSV